MLRLEKENGPENHIWYRRLCTYFKKVFEDRPLLCETKVMNTRWISYIFSMKLLIFDTVWHRKTIAPVLLIYKQKGSKIILISWQRHCMFPL